jgi:hypothetical protein
MSPRRRGPEDTTSLDSASSPGRFESALDEEGRFGRTERDEALADEGRAYLDTDAPAPLQTQHVPLPLWRVPSDNSIGLASDVDQVRWLQIVTFLQLGESVDVPLLDSEGFPLVSPSIPPLVVLRGREETADTNRVANPFATNIRWTDQWTNLDRNRIGDDTLFNDNSVFTYKLILKKRPRPHWVVRLSHDFFDPNQSSAVTAANILCHVLGEGGGIPGEPGTGGIPATPDDVDPTPGPLTVGSGSGQFSLWKPYARHSHLATPDQEGLRRHVIGNGETYLQAGFSRVVYLNSPSGLAGDANVFESPTVASDIGPAVLAFGEQRTATNNTTTQNAWQAAARGRGHLFTGIANPPIHNQCDQWCFYTELYWDGADWALEVFNDGTVSPGDDRQYFFWAWGYRDNV